MQKIDDITLIISIVVLVVAIVSPFINVMVRRLRALGRDEDSAGISDNEGHRQAAGISIVLTVNDEGEDLKENLPLILDQDYPGGYQVIVVMTGNDEMVENVLKGFAGNPHLYATFIPDSSRYMSRTKLAITVGVKAAKYGWVLLTDVDCRPDSKRWLNGMAIGCNDNTDIMLGYSSFTDDYITTRRFDHVYNIYRQLVDAERGKAWGYCGNNLLFRKKTFLYGKGFEGNLKYIRGEYDFIVNKFADSSNTGVLVLPDVRMSETELTDKGWRNKNLYYMSTRRRLAGTRRPRMFFNLTMWMMVMGYLLCIAGIAVGSLTQRWVTLGVCSLAFVINIVLRAVVLKKSIGKLLNDVSAPYLLLLELTMPLRNAVKMIRYKFTDKYDFISHKI